MKKFIAIVLCFAMLVSALALTISATAELIADKLDLRDLSQFGTDSTYADGDNWWAPIIDGAVTEGEYDTEKVWNDDNRRFANANSISAGKTLTEYVAHDSEYVYIAFVSTENVKEFTFYMNATEAMLTDHDQCGIVSTLFFNLNGQDENDSPVAGSTVHTAVTSTPVETLRAFEEGEYEAYAKRNYDGDAFVNVTVEIKMSKAAMEDIFDVDSVEHFGYYVDGAKTSGGHYVNSRKYTGTTSTTKFTGMAQFESTYGVNRGTYYGNQGRVLNFVIFDKAPAPVHYCPVGCTCEGVERTTEFSLADITQWSQLPSTYVTVMRGFPVVDGVVGSNEYTSVKVYDEANDFTNWADNTVTVTEYVAHDDDYVYMALVYNADMKYTQIRMNGTPAVRTGVLATETRYEFHYTFNSATEVAVTQNKKNFSEEFAASEFVGFGKKADGTTTVELKLSKAAMKRVFATDTLDCFGYYGEAQTAAGAAITNAGRFRNDALTACGWGTSSAAMAAAYGLDMTKYNSSWRIMNVVVLTGESLSDTVPMYCPEIPPCTYANHANRAETFDFSNAESLGRLPSTYLTTNVTTAPAQDGSIGGTEYTTTKTYTSGHVVRYNSASTVYNETVVEYAAQDENNVYLALVSPQGNWRTDLFLDANQDIFSSIKDKCDRCLQIRIDTNGASQTAIGIGGRTFTTDGETPELVVKCVRNSTNNIIEIKMTKEGLKRVFQTDLERGFGYNFRYLASNDAIASSQITSYGGFDNLSDLVAAYGLTAPHGSFLSGTNMFYNFVMFEAAPTTPAIYCAPSGCPVDGHDRRADTFDVADMRCLNLKPGNFVTEKIVNPAKDVERAAYGNLPVMDGVVNANEYTAVKVYDSANDFTNWADNTVTVTEYVAHDADYVYMALVYNADMKYTQIRMNGTPDVRTGVLATETRFEFHYTFNSANEVVVTQNKKNFSDTFSANEIEGFGKKANGTTTVELKLSKAAMKRVFATETLDCFGYYGEAQTAAGAAITNAGRFRNDALTACGWGTSSAAMAAAYGLDMSKYNSSWRIMNVVVLTGETLSETVPNYCPEVPPCTYENHANRAETFDYSNAESLGRLPSTYLTTNVTTAPAQDGAIGTDEYTTVKTYSGDDLPTDSGQVAKEYAAQDDDYVYLAFETRKDNWHFDLFLNGYNNIFSNIENDNNPYLMIKLEVCNYQGQVAAGTGGRTLTVDGDTPELVVKWVDNGTTDVIEFKIAKSGLERVFNNEIDRGFGYTVRYMASNSWRWIASPVKSYGGFNSLAELAASYGATLGDGTAYMNFVMFEAAPTTPAIYCAPSGCPAAGHANRVETFDVADMRCLGLKAGNFVPYEIKGYGANGVIDAAEYRTVTKFENKDANGNPFVRAAGSPDFAAGALPVAGGYVKEFVAQDDNYIYLGFEMNQDMAEATIFFNGKEEAATDIYEHSNVQMFKYTFAEDSDVAFAEVDSVYGEDDYTGTARKYYNANGDFTKLVVELQIAKAAIKEECGRKTVDFVAYSFFAKSPDKNAYDNVHLCSRITEAEVVANSDFESLDAFLAQYDPYNAYEENGNKLLRFVCFYEEPAEHNVYGVIEPEVEDTTTEEPTTAEPTTAEPTTAEPTTEEPTTAEPTTAEPTTAEPTTAEPTTAEPTTAEPTTAEPTTAEPTTAEPTTAEPTTAEPTTAEPTTAEATTKAATTAATTAAEEKGCGKSIALSALAIVPVLGLGVAVVSKKKED